MMPPTDTEIEAAYNKITQRGPNAPWVDTLAAVCVQSRHIQNVIYRQARFLQRMLKLPAGQEDTIIHVLTGVYCHAMDLTLSVAEEVRPRPAFFTYTIYKHPRDYPDKYVARAFHVDQPLGIMGIGDSLEAVRDMLPPGLTLIGRRPEDEPQIVETWV